MLSKELQDVLSNAMESARIKSHEFMTVEHLLLALTKEPVAKRVLEACGIVIEKLETDLEKFIQDNFPEVLFHQMKTGYTWDTQDRDKDKAAAISSWKVAKKALADESLHLVVLDELTYMLSFKYLDESEVIQALNNRPKNQSVVITGRGGGKKLKNLADTVSEVRDIKHAFNSQIMARKGVDY